jgi:hypothetical protein
MTSKAVKVKPIPKAICGEASPIRATRNEIKATPIDRKKIGSRYITLFSLF